MSHLLSVCWVTSSTHPPSWPPPGCSCAVVMSTMKIKLIQHAFIHSHPIHLVHATMTEEVSNSVCSLVRGYSVCSLQLWSTHWHTTHQLPQPLWNTCLNSESEVGEERKENNKKGSPEKEIGPSYNWSTDLTSKSTWYDRTDRAAKRSNS